MKKLLVVLLVLGLAAPAMAASQWYWYGTAQVLMGWEDNSKDLQPSYGATPYGGGLPDLDTSIRSTEVGGTQYSDSGLLLNVQDTTKIGAKVVVSDAVSAGVELSILQVPIVANSGDQALTSDGIIMRVLYGQWKFGAGSLRVGQDYTPATFLLYSNEVGDQGWGGNEIMTVTGGIPYISRRPQLKLTFGGLQVALIEHNTTTAYDAIRTITNPRPAIKGGIYSTVYAAQIAGGATEAAAAAAAAAYSESVLPGDPIATIDDEDFSLPRIELAYQWNISPMISLRPIFGFQTYDAVAHTAISETSKTITSYHYGLGVNLRFNPVYVNLAISGEQNPGNYGLYQPNNAYTRFATLDGNGDVKDATGLAGLAVVGVTISPMVKVEAGIGYLKTENESYLFTRDGQFTKAEQVSMNYYIQAPITLAPGVSITPEIGMIDMGDLDNKTTNTKVDQGTNTWYAVQFRIDF